MFELTVAEKWMVATLGADVTIAAAVGTKIYTHVIPEGTAFPYIFITFQGGSDVLTNGAYRIMSNLRYAVRAVSNATSNESARPIADRIDTVLHGKQGTVDLGVVLSAVRDSPFFMIEVRDGMHLRHVGGIYRVSSK